MHLVLLLALAAAPTADQCEQLWSDTVAAAAPDLDPTDDLRKGYLLREKSALMSKCAAATPDALHCPAEASKACAAKFPQPPDGGRALGLATCVWPEVQACVQGDYVAASQLAIDVLLAELESGKAQPARGVLKLTGERALLSMRGEALAEKQGAGFWLLLVTRRAGARVDGVLLRSAHGAPLPRSGALAIAGLHARVIKALGAGLLVSNAK